MAPAAGEAATVEAGTMAPAAVEAGTVESGTVEGVIVEGVMAPSTWRLQIDGKRDGLSDSQRRA